MPSVDLVLSWGIEILIMISILLFSIILAIIILSIHHLTNLIKSLRRMSELAKDEIVDRRLENLHRRRL